MTRLAVLSDTHGLLRPRVLELVAGADLILHGGDVGDPEILTRLGTLAPVVAVRGNVDHGPGVADLPETAEGEVAGRVYRMVHRRQDIEPTWTRDAALIVFGHSHRPELEWRSGTLLLNPGSVGPPRFSLPATMAFVTFDGKTMTPELVSVAG
ncbi:MAG: metallophosphoesterase family protein [Acidobacteriota bacterium]